MYKEKLRAYDIPPGKRIAEGISLFADDIRVGAFFTEVNNTHIWRQDFGWTLSYAAVGIFDFDGEVNVRVHTEFDVENVRLIFCLSFRIP